MPNASNCPTCRNWQARVKNAQELHKPDLARVLYGLWQNHLEEVDYHQKPALAQTLWPGAEIVEPGEINP